MENRKLYDRHVFVCTNQRPEGASRPSCGDVTGAELVKAFREKMKQRGLDVNMRAQSSGCFHICESGPNVAIYPEGVFYGHVQLSDVEEIVEEHLVNGRIVERLALSFPEK